MTRGGLATSILAVLAAACANSAARPPLWTALDHKHAAVAHLGVAEREAELFDPKQRPSLPCPGIGFLGNGCIRRTVNPTAIHLDVAAAEKRRADQHLNAESALVDEEDELCRGMTLDDREQGPLLLWSRPFSAQPLVAYSGGGTFFGVVLDLPGGPPDADRLQAQAACHRAHLLGRGESTPEHECALDDASLTVLVIATSRGSLLQLRADDFDAGRRAWERGRRAATASHSRHDARGSN